MVILRFKTCDLRFADVLEAVNHIGRQEPSAISGNFRMEIHKIAREVGCHIVVNAVVESIDTIAVPAICALALIAKIEVEGLFGLQVRIANPVVAKARALKSHRRTCIHFPVVVKLPHARLGIARAEVRLEALVRLAADVVRHADIERRMRAKKAAMIDAQNWRKQRISIDLPCVLQKYILLLNLYTADRQSVLPRLKFLVERFSVPKRCVSISLAIIFPHIFIIVVVNRRGFRQDWQIMISRIILQLFAERHEPRHNIWRRRIPVFIIALRAIFQIVLICIDWLQ